MTAFLNWIAAYFTPCWHWLKQVGQRALAALMMILMPVSLGLVSVNRNLSSVQPISQNSLVAAGPLLPEVRVEDLPVQEDDRRGRMAERRTNQQRSGLSWSAAISEPEPVLLPMMLEQMDRAVEWHYQTLLPAPCSAVAAPGSFGFLSKT